MLLKIDFNKKAQKEFDEVQVDFPSIKALDPSLFVTIRYANKKTGTISSPQMIPVTDICDPEEGNESSSAVTKLEKTINHDKENAGQSPRKPTHN